MIASSVRRDTMVLCELAMVLACFLWLLMFKSLNITRIFCISLSERALELDLEMLGR